MRFLIDENLTHKLAQILNIAFTGHHQFETMHDLGLNSIPDIEWITQVAHLEPRPVILTGDIRLRGRIPERDALQASGLTVFMFRRMSNRRLDEMAWMMIRVLPAVADMAQVAPGMVFDVSAEKMMIRRKTPVQDQGHTT